MDVSGFSYLIVDDVRTVRMTVLQMLKGAAPPKAAHADNGREALAALAVSGDLIDAVITDINMPEMNGLQLLKAIRTGSAKVRRDLPVAVFTGFGDMALVGVAMALDANAFLVKPAARSVVVDRIARMMEAVSSGETWLRPAEAYADVPLPNLDDGAAAPGGDKAQAPAPAAPPPPAAQGNGAGAAAGVAIDIKAAKAGLVLAREVLTEGGALVLPTGTMLSERHIARLGDLAELSPRMRTLWVTEAPPAA